MQVYMSLALSKLLAKISIVLLEFIGAFLKCSVVGFEVGNSIRTLLLDPPATVAQSEIIGS